MLLYEFGFTDFRVNEHLLVKINDVNTVAELLMNGQVSEKMIESIYAAAGQRK